MKILFAMLRPVYLRYFDSTVRLLADRGHSIHLAFSELGSSAKWVDRTTELSRSYARISFEVAPVRDRQDVRHDVVSAIRLLGDFGRYIDPRFKESSSLRARAERSMTQAAESNRVPSALRRVSLPMIRWLGRQSSTSLSTLVVGVARLAEEVIPANDAFVEYVGERAPDIVLATPLVDFGSDQIEFVKAAQLLNIPNSLCVASWDNLTNKGVLRVQPDVVFVWNEFQRQEARELHRVRPEHTVVTGAPRFDEWFERVPSRSAAEFRRAAGLDPRMPHVLYVCSSSFVAPHEVSFVESWARAIRSSDYPDFHRLGLLVRPHPQNAAQWETARLPDLENVAIWPQESKVADTESPFDFYDSIVHSVAVVGINTSAQIEACILGKSVLSVLDPGFARTQVGTLHYRYLRSQNGGFLHEATTLDEHVRQLHRVITGEMDNRAEGRRFVEAFVRPLGLHHASTVNLVNGIERLATRTWRPPSASADRLHRPGRSQVA